MGKTAMGRADIETSQPTQATPKERIIWVDQLRGFLIILMIVGHTPIYPEWRHYLYAFHGPAFFLLSGLLVNPKTKFIPFTWRKAHTLLTPYLLFGLLSYAFWLQIRGFSQAAMATPIEQPLLGMLYGSDELLSHNPALWFLPCMFLTTLFVWWGGQFPPWLRGAVFFVIGAVGLWLGQWEPLPWSVDVAMVVSMFAGIALMSSRWILHRMRPNSGLLLLALGINISLGLLNSRVDLAASQYGHPVLFLGAALAGSYVLLDLIKRLPYNALLTHIGQNSVPIFSLHFLVFLIITGLSKKIFQYPLMLTYEGLMRVNETANPVLVALLYIIPGLFIPLGVALTYNRLKAWGISQNQLHYSTR